MKPVLAFVASSPVAPTAPRTVERPRPGYVEASGSGRHHVLAAGIVALHLLALWGLSQMQGLQRTVARVAPVVVRLIAPAEPPRPLPTPPVEMPHLQTPAPRLIDTPVIAIAPAAAPSPVVAVPPPPPPAVAPTAAALLAPVAPPPAPALRRIPASAVRYLREPRMTVPLLSRRLRESGVVQLRVVVDVHGQPREITLAKSSGFARLDEQALLDMRSARFVPQTENGRPVEWEVIAPMSYEVDR